LLNNVIRISEAANKSAIEPKNNKEEEQMKKSNIIKISEIAKKYAFRGSSALLTALAIVFASATCLTHFYEPEVPRKLWEKD